VDENKQGAAPILFCAENLSKMSGHLAMLVGWARIEKAVKKSGREREETIRNNIFV